MNVSEQIAEWLVEQGLEVVFTVTGGGAMFLNQAIGSHPKLRTIFMHHEQACAMAAEGYARIACKPAVLMLTTGPGAINSLNGVFGAYTDSIPMIVISGQVKRETCLDFQDCQGLRQLGDQEGPTIAIARNITKYAKVIRESKDLESVLPEALANATGGRPGPVWIDIPLDLQGSKETLSIKRIESKPTEVNGALEKDCKAIIEKLRQANRPLILGGTGVRLAGVRDRLLSLIEKKGVPMATAWTHDLIASDHPLFAGRPGTIGTRAGNFCLQNADFVLVLGSRLNIRQTSYNFDSFANKAWVAQVDVDPAELNKPTYKPDLGVESDLGLFLDEFEHQLESIKLPDFEKWATWCRSMREQYGVNKEHEQKPGQPLNPYLVVDQIFKQMRDNDIVACANASACILPFQIGELKHNQRLFSNSGSASMGYDLPAAIGAALSDGIGKKRRVICFAGDGSLQMNIQELQTLKTIGANVIVIVLNNSGYLSIWQTHENFFGKVIGATPASGVEFPDFTAIAKAYGLDSALVKSEQDLENLRSIMERDGPLLIEILVDSRQEFAPRIKSRVDAEGKFITPELDDMHPFLDPQKLASIRSEAAEIRSIPR